MKRFAVIAALLLSFCLPALAQETFPNYVNGLSPAGLITGAEYFYLLQNGASRKVQGSSLVAPGSAMAPTPSGPISFTPPAVFNIVDYGAKCDDTTSDDAAINRTFAAAFAANGGTITGPGNSKKCLVNATGINATNYNPTSPNNLVVDFSGMSLDCRVAGGVCVDAVQSTLLFWKSLAITGVSGASEPAVGFQSGRGSAISSGGRADRNKYDFLNISGYFSETPLLLVGAEITKVDHCILYNQDNGATAYSLIDDGYNHFNLHSAFYTVTLPADTATSFNDVNFDNCAIQQVGGNAPALWIGNIAGHNFSGRTYISTAATSGPEVVLYTEAGGGGISNLNMQAHFEPASGVAYIFQLAGSQTTPTLYGISYTDHNSPATISIFSRGAETSATIYGLNLLVTEMSGSATVYDTAADYNTYGAFIFVPVTGNWVRSSAVFFAGVVCNPFCEGDFTNTYLDGSLGVQFLNNAAGISFRGGGTAFYSPANGVLQFGGGDVAAPQAQTLQSVSIAAGNGNTPGVLFTISGSKSNGSGGGDIALQTTASSASSGVQNSLVTAMTVKGTTQKLQFNSANSFVAASNCGSLSTSTGCLAILDNNGNTVYLPIYGTP